MLTSDDFNGVSPVAIGGVGGSGTRFLAKSLDRLGYHMGDELNRAFDNEWFSFLFRRASIFDACIEEVELLFSIFLNVMTKRRPLTLIERACIDSIAKEKRLHHTLEWSVTKRDRIAVACECANEWRSNRAWGWKEPNTHIVVDRLMVTTDELRYIHLCRNGLDMACSRNQLQLELWGPKMLGRPVQIGPYDSLKYWCRAHKRMLSLAATYKDRFLLLNYDRMCAHPHEETKKMLVFLQIEPCYQVLDALVKNLQPSPNIGRFKRVANLNFDPKDVEFVGSLGFEVG